MVVVVPGLCLPFTVKIEAIYMCRFQITISNIRTSGPVNAHLIPEQIISTKPGYK